MTCIARQHPRTKRHHHEINNLARRSVPLTRLARSFLSLSKDAPGMTPEVEEGREGRMPLHARADVPQPSMAGLRSEDPGQRSRTVRKPHALHPVFCPRQQLAFGLPPQFSITASRRRAEPRSWFYSSSTRVSPPPKNLAPLPERCSQQPPWPILVAHPWAARRRRFNRRLPKVDAPLRLLQG